MPKKCPRSAWLVLQNAGWGKNEGPQYKSVESPQQRVFPYDGLKHSVHDKGVPGSSDEGDAAAGLVDLPHVQLLVLLQGLLELGGGEATRDATLLCFGHANHAAGSTAARHALCGELTHQREDDVGRALSPEQKQFRPLDVRRTLVWLLLHWCWVDRKIRKCEYSFKGIVLGNTLSIPCWELDKTLWFMYKWNKIQHVSELLRFR